MTNEKFKEFQNNISLILGTIFILEEEGYTEKNMNNSDAWNEIDITNFLRKVTKKVKTEPLFAKKIIFYTRIIGQVIKDTLIEE